MAYPTKITTCCYCGARAALVLRGKESHELSCSSCGAPIHQMKRLEPAPKPAPTATQPKQKKKKKAVSHLPTPKSFQPAKSSKKPKKRKSMLRWFAEEAFDVIEDIFD